VLVWFKVFSAIISSLFLAFGQLIPAAISGRVLRLASAHCRIIVLDNAGV